MGGMGGMQQPGMGMQSQPMGQMGGFGAPQGNTGYGRPM